MQFFVNFLYGNLLSRTAGILSTRLNSRESRLFFFFIFQLNKCLLENQKLWQEKLKQTEKKLQQEEAARKQVSLSRHSAADGR